MTAFDIDILSSWPKEVRVLVEQIKYEFDSPESVSVFRKDELDATLKHKVRDYVLYHYTKESERFPFKKQGLRILDPKLHTTWFLDNFSRHFTPDEISRMQEVFEMQNIGYRRQPKGSLYFVNAPQQVGHELNMMEEFVSYFGGEEIFWNFKDHYGQSEIDASILAKLKRIGRGCYVRFLGRSADIKHESFADSVIKKAFGQEHYSCIGSISANVPPERIIEVKYM